jgi:hypothetical protein
MTPSKQPIKISELNHKILLRLKLDWDVKSVDDVLTKLILKAGENHE